jgi:hypothetical protein
LNLFAFAKWFGSSIFCEHTFSQNILSFNKLRFICQLDASWQTLKANIMKTLLTFYLLTLFINISIAQTTAIPDLNFEQALISQGYDIGPPDGAIPTSNIDTITFLDF